MYGGRGAPVHSNGEERLNVATLVIKSALLGYYSGDLMLRDIYIWRYIFFTSGPVFLCTVHVMFTYSMTVCVLDTRCVLCMFFDCFVYCTKGVYVLLGMLWNCMYSLTFCCTGHKLCTVSILYTLTVYWTQGVYIMIFDCFCVLYTRCVFTLTVLLYRKQGVYVLWNLCTGHEMSSLDAGPGEEEMLMQQVKIQIAECIL